MGSVLRGELVLRIGDQYGWSWATHTEGRKKSKLLPPIFSSLRTKRFGKYQLGDQRFLKPFLRGCCDDY